MKNVTQFPELANIKKWSSYLNGEVFRFKNKRIAIIKDKRGKGFDFEFTNLYPKDEKGSTVQYEVIKGCIHVTTINLSNEASVSIMSSIANQLGYKVVKGV